jgi:hypothetical protein
MCSQKHYYSPPLQVLIEPGPGSLAVGYVCTSSMQDDSIDLNLQRRRIAEFAESKGWELFKWYEEPEVYRDTEQYHVFAHLLDDAGSQFQIVLYSASKNRSRKMCCVYGSLDHIRWLGVWWVTAERRWGINIIWHESFNLVCVQKCARAVNSDLRKSQKRRREEY